MKFLLVLSLSFLFTARSCVGAGNELPQGPDLIPDEVTVEEYAVYSTVLKDGQRVGRETSAFMSDFAQERKGLADMAPSIDQGTLDGFERANAKKYPLGDHFKPRVAIVAEDSFGEGREKGITHVSRVGFNHEKTQALLYVSFKCSPVCADDYYDVLAKEGGSWKVIKTVHLRIWN